MAFKLPTLCTVRQSIPCDLPAFDFNDLKDKKVIGNGSFGIVYKASHNNATVIVKKIASEAIEGEKLFLKEAKLIHSFQHANIVGFKGFCGLPCSIMLEYLYFDFTPFGSDKIITNLGDFLNCMDRIDGFKSFNDTMHSKI